MSYRSPRSLISASLVLLTAWGCSSLKDANPADPGALDGSAEGAALDGSGPGTPDGSEGRDGSTNPPADGAPDVNPADYGAGPLGALPNGFCCAADDDCRHRHCNLVNGTQMCLDFCSSEDDCTGVTTGFHCVFSEPGNGRCMPAATVTTCASPTQYKHGKKPLGACCQVRSDGRQGSECLSGVCAQNGSQNPYFCSINCEATGCPLTWTCGPGDDFSTRLQCYPVAHPYGCTP
jgi:hypothetical protein